MKPRPRKSQSCARKPLGQSGDTLRNCIHPNQRRCLCINATITETIETKLQEGMCPPARSPPHRTRSPGKRGLCQRPSQNWEPRGARLSPAAGGATGDLQEPGSDTGRAVLSPHAPAQCALVRNCTRACAHTHTHSRTHTHGTERPARPSCPLCGCVGLRLCAQLSLNQAHDYKTIKMKLP